jgi:hypothetical protein
VADPEIAQPPLLPPVRVRLATRCARQPLYYGRLDTPTEGAEHDNVCWALTTHSVRRGSPVATHGTPVCLPRTHST